MTGARLLHALPCVLALAIGACGDGTGPDYTLTTDATRYRAHRVDGGVPYYTFTVVARFTNHTGRTAFLDRCDTRVSTPIYYIDAAGRDTSSAYNTFWACVAVPPLEVGPGETRTDTLQLFGADFSGPALTPFGVLDGPHRLVYGTVRSRAFRVTRAD